MKIIKQFTTVMMVILSITAKTQQSSLNTLYNQNQYLINPAAAGLEDCFSAYINHRNQWVGINDSPVRNALTLDGRVFGAHGIGIDARMEQAGLLQSFNAKLTYAYHIRLSEDANLSLGISAGMIQQSFAFSDAIATDYTDNSLLFANQSDLGFTSDAGILFTKPRIRIGLSVPQIYSRGLTTYSNDGYDDYKLVQHYNLHGSIDVIKTNNWIVTPSLLYKNADFIGHQFDIGLHAEWKNIFGLGSIYRTSYGVIGMVDLNLKGKFKIAYGYGFGGNQLAGLSSGSHEIMIGIKLCRKQPQNSETPILPIDESSEIIEVQEESMIDEVAPNQIAPEREENRIVEIDSVAPKAQQKAEDVNPMVSAIKPNQLNIDSLNRSFEMTDKLIVFELNSAAQINSKNEDKVTQEVADILKQHDDLIVHIIGHTCDLGSTGNNYNVGKNRAITLKNTLLKLKVDDLQIETESLGESNPRKPNDSEENRMQNRRVQFVFSRKEQ